MEKIFWIVMLALSSGYIGYWIGKRKGKKD